MELLLDAGHRDSGQIKAAKGKALFTHQALACKENWLSLIVPGTLYTLFSPISSAKGHIESDFNRSCSVLSHGT